MTTPALLPLLQDALPAIVPADTAWMLVATALVLLMTPGPRLLLRRPGPVQELAQHHDDELRRPGGGGHPVGAGRRTASPSRRAARGWAGWATRCWPGSGSRPRAPFRTSCSWPIRAPSRSSPRRSSPGAIVERMRFGPYVAFILLWTLLVYAPVAHWVWGGGWLMTQGVLDFAGGTVVHINAGVSALVAALVLGGAEGLRPAGDPAAQRALRPARRGAALVRLVRFQRWQRARRG